MKEDFSELIQHLDDKFSNIDSQLDCLKECKADKSDVRELMRTIEKADTYFQELEYKL